MVAGLRSRTPGLRVDDFCTSCLMHTPAKRAQPRIQVRAFKSRASFDGLCVGTPSVVDILSSAHAHTHYRGEGRQPAPALCVWHTHPHSLYHTNGSYRGKMMQRDDSRMRGKTTLKQGGWHSTRAATRGNGMRLAMRCGCSDFLSAAAVPCSRYQACGWESRSWHTSTRAHMHAACGRENTPAVGWLAGWVFATRSCRTYTHTARHA